MLAGFGEPNPAGVNGLTCGMPAPFQANRRSRIAIIHMGDDARRLFRIACAQLFSDMAFMGLKKESPLFGVLRVFGHGHASPRINHNLEKPGATQPCAALGSA